MKLTLIALALLTQPVFSPQPPADPPVVQSACTTMVVTAYNRVDPAMNAFTFDGTSIFTDEPIVAAGWDIPIDTILDIVGLGSFRVADRGSGLGYRHLDVAMWSQREAINWGRQYRTVCMEG